MQFLFNHDEAVSIWVANQLGDSHFHAYDSAWGLIDSAGELKGGCVFSNYTGTSIALSLAGGAVFQRQNLMAICNYVFGQLGCSRLEVRIRKSDAKLKKILPRLGLEYEGHARHFYGDEDGLIFSLTKRNLPAFLKKWN